MPIGSRMSQTIISTTPSSRRTSASFGLDAKTGNLVGAGISFTAPNVISDTGNGLGIFLINDIFEVRGSILNSRSYLVTSVGAGFITVAGSLIRTEATGPTLTLVRD